MIDRVHARLERTILASSILAGLMISGDPAWAQVTATEQYAAPESQTAQGEATRSFNIPAQPLSSALVQYGQQARQQVSVDGEIVRGVTSPGVQGTMTPDAALRALLAGSNLSYSRGAAGVVTVMRPVESGTLQLDPVQVQGEFRVPSQAMIDNVPPPYAGGQVATGGQLGLLGNRDVMDTPFNQTSFTAKKAQDQQAKTIRDVLIDDPSVRSFFPDSGSGTDTVRIRGFAVPSASISYGGLYGVLPTSSIMAEIADRIEVLKGPSAMLNGVPPGGAIGGTINLVPKRAPDNPLTQFTASYASSAQFGGAADIGRRFGEDKQFGVRFNGAFRAGETAVQNSTDERGLAVLGLDFRGRNVRLSADLGYQQQYIGGLIPYFGVAASVALPWAPDARKNPEQPWSYQQRKDLFGVIRAEVDLSETVTAYATFGAHDYRTTRLSGGTALTATTFSGNARATTSNFSQYQQFLTAETGLRAIVDTGPVNHEFAFVATTLQREIGAATVNGVSYNTNIYNPTFIARPNIPTGAANKTSVDSQSSLAIADTLSAADKRIQLTVGARLQRVAEANFNVTSGQRTDSYDQSAISPSVALIFKPWEHVSLYANWIQGLQSGTVVSDAFTNAGEIFPPFKSTQYEAGVKVDWGKFTTTASVFQITQPSILTNTANNTQFLGGEQRNQGFEFNVFGEPTEGVRLIGGVMLLSAVLTKTQGGLTDGWIAPFSPGAQFNLGGEWDMPFVSNLTLVGRVVYTGAQFIDTLPSRRSLPEWTRFDVGARYVFDNPGAKGKPLVARFNVENLLDANYWANGSSATTLSLGAPRTFRLSLTADF